MRLLLPSPAPLPEPLADGVDAAEIDPLDAYDEERPQPEGRPWVMVDMIASLDGATAVEGKSGALGGPGDKAVFRALRAVPDVILVGAATARVEAYGPIRLDDAVMARRRRRGQQDQPRLALVSGRLDLDPDATMFSDASEPPLVLTTEPALADRGDAFAGRAEVVAVGSESVDLAAAMVVLHDRGARCVLVEGGPSLNGQLVAADLVDEWCQSISPLLVAGDSARVAHGPSTRRPTRLVLHRLLEQDSYLFGTWRRPS